MSHLSLRGWAKPAELTQIAKDYRAAIALIEEQGWARIMTDGSDGSPICAARALGLVCGIKDWKDFASRITLALSACYRVTGVLLNQANDKCTNWPDMRSIMEGIAAECDQAALVTGTTILSPGDLNA